MSGGKPETPELVLTPPEVGPARGDPIGRTKGFVERVREVYGQKFVDSWLFRATCDFSRFEVRTTPLGAAYLQRRCRLIARKFEILIVADKALEGRVVVRNKERRG